MTAFAAVALTLALVGVFGVLAYSVQQRTREFGVRIALGAGTWDVLRLVLGGAVRLTVAGAVIGLLLAAMLTRCYRVAVVRRPAARSRDVCRHRGRPGSGRAGRRGRAGVARDPRRSGDSVQRRVMKRSLRSWLWRVPIDQEVEEELAFHLEMRRREGKPIDPADVERVRQACVEIARKRDREMRLTTWLEERRTDIRFALRQLRRAPGFAAVAVLTLALGIGANSAIFALADATFFQSLPFTHPADRLVMIWESRGPGTFITATPADYRRLARSESDRWPRLPRCRWGWRG